MAVNWSTYLTQARTGFAYLDERWGIPHQVAALLTWVDSLDADGQPVYRFNVDFPDEFEVVPSVVNPLPDLPNVRVVNASDVHVPGAKLERYAKIGGFWVNYPVTERQPWGAGDLAIVAVVASEAALDHMVEPAHREHLPLMRKYINPATPDPTLYAPDEPFPSNQVGIIADWFNDLGAQGNTKYPSGLTANQVATFFGQYVPEVTSAATMATWMQTEPRRRSIATFADVFEFAP